MTDIEDKHSAERIARFPGLRLLDEVYDPVIPDAKPPVLRVLENTAVSRIRVFGKGGESFPDAFRMVGADSLFEGLLRRPLENEPIRHAN